ncbi:unnamed protein product [Didymodactylos carnosus]|uniref:Uncharacterized protein n=1 Tax=Didymodactylos carnosus TaxID=1234261 RepID=A0A815BPT6_9BILA|nr:unnamed protein product [Didymodactylos carnosus]CAF4065188.1 unnamed protein product [Didymodactylos carnosus]
MTMFAESFDHTVEKGVMDLIFLRTCLREQLKPVFIRIKLPQHIQNSKAATQLRLRLLLGFKTEYYDYDKKNDDDIISYNLTPAQVSGAINLRRITDKFIHRSRHELRNTHDLSAKYRGILKALASDKSIIIYKPDKGRGIVILDRAEYIEKMNDIVSDTKTFRKITFEPTISKEGKLIRLLGSLRGRAFITENEYKLARPCGSQFARLYGLPKVHKPNRPIRPILSSVKTFNYGLGHMLAQRLQHLRTSPQHD